MTHSDDPAEHVRLLGNGRYSLLVTAAGTGFSAWQGYALTDWQADRTEDAHGFFVYLRDVDRGTFWSAADQPTAVRADSYSVHREPGSLRIERRDDDIETTTAICVAPEDDVELRTLCLRNRSSVVRRIEVTTFAEVVLHDAAAHSAHPAFSKLFVQTELDADTGGLLAHRRPRSPDEVTLWMGHALLGPGMQQLETDRSRFIGRGRTKVSPRAVTSATALSEMLGNVLDPILSVRRSVELKPAQSVELVSLLAAGGCRRDVVTLLGRYSATAAVSHAFEQAAKTEAALADRSGITGREADHYERLAGAILYGHPAVHPGRVVACDRADVLAARDITPRGRLLVVEAAGERGAVLLHSMLGAQAYWRAKGLDVHLVFVTDNVHEARRDVRARAIGLGETPPISILSLPSLDDQTKAAIYTAAGAVIRGQLPVFSEEWGAPAASVRPDQGPRASTAEKRAGEELRFGNGYGGFSADGREYVIRLVPGADGAPIRPPLPWINVIANEGFGFLISESGAGYSWSRNSRENRLTPWRNDPISDPHGEALYLRDEESGVFWSPMPGPVPASAAYEVRHGFGYSVCKHGSNELEQEVTLFVPPNDPVKIVRLRLHNRSERRRRLSAFSYQHLVLGVLPSESARTIVTSYDDELQALIACNPVGKELADGLVFCAAVGATEPPRYSADRTAFLGHHRDPSRPAALEAGTSLDGASGTGLDPCAALQVGLEIEPGETVECAFLLGETTSREAVKRLVRRYRVKGAIAGVLAEVKQFWERTLSAVQVATPSPAIDLMLNGWLEYQTLSCRLWARSAFYQSGGAFGYRDQLQDSAALVYAAPALTRAQLLLHAAHQFVEGDVLHWWHPPSGRGIRTRFSDDLLWLPYVMAFYVRTTGDWGVLEEVADFVTARSLRRNEDEAYLFPQAAEAPATLYDHCCRALDRSLTRGAHGLPLMGTGDWNDGMNRVGREGKGESVWLGFFLYSILGDFVSICQRRGDSVREQAYTRYREELAQSLNDGGWDGGWYLRAYYDDGTPLGSAADSECRIDAVAQAWAVMSGAAPRERAMQAMEAVERELVLEEGRLIRLLAPPFDRTPHDPGYIKGYVPGIRENGGQYTHAAVWVVRALAELGRRDRAAELLEMISPVSHGTSDEIAVYMLEPYVVAADIYGEPPHVGRGGWSWYTGSAAWMQRVALESVLGFTIEEGRSVRLRPCVPDDWPGYRITYRLPGSATRYDIEVVVEGSAAAVRSVVIDGKPGVINNGAALIPLEHDDRPHQVRVTLSSPPAASL